MQSVFTYQGQMDGHTGTDIQARASMTARQHPDTENRETGAKELGQSPR